MGEIRLGESVSRHPIRHPPTPSLAHPSYTKPRGQVPDYTAPVVLRRSKCTVEDFCNAIHKEIAKQFRTGESISPIIYHQKALANGSNGLGNVSETCARAESRSGPCARG